MTRRVFHYSSVRLLHPGECPLFQLAHLVRCIDECETLGATTTSFWLNRRRYRLLDDRLQGLLSRVPQRGAIRFLYGHVIQIRYLRFIYIIVSNFRCNWCVSGMGRGECYIGLNSITRTTSRAGLVISNFHVQLVRAASTLVRPKRSVLFLYARRSLHIPPRRAGLNSPRINYHNRVLLPYR